MALTLICLCYFAKRCPLSFRLNTVIARVQVSVAGYPGLLSAYPSPAESREKRAQAENLSVGGWLTCFV